MKYIIDSYDDVQLVAVVKVIQDGEDPIFAQKFPISLLDVDTLDQFQTRVFQTYYANLPARVRGTIGAAVEQHVVLTQGMQHSFTISLDAYNTIQAAMSNASSSTGTTQATVI